MANTVTIDIEVNDTIVQQGDQAGAKFTRSFEQALAPIDRVFDKTARSITTQLDKIERTAWETGRGMDDSFGTAMAGLRRALELTQTEARETGAGLHSSVGDALREIQRDARKLSDSMKPVAQSATEVNKAFDKTARLVGVELDRIERDAWDAGRGTDAAFQAALKSVRDDFERVADVGRRTGATLESELGQSLREIKRDMDRLGAEARETGQEIQRELGGAAEQSGESFGDIFGQGLAGGMDVGGMFEGLVGKAGMGAGAAAAGAAVGTIIAEQAFSAMQGWLQERSIGGLIAAQSGGTVREGLALGRVVGESFAEGFGESIEDVGAAASAVIGKGLIGMDAAPGAIRQITELATTAAQITGKSADEVASAIRVMLKTGLADNAREAFDLIVTGFQRGADAGDDMVEELTQSGSNLKQFGFTGQQSLGMFIQALEAGAPSADAFTGALEELIGNASDGIPIFDRLGLGGADFASKLAGGGPKAAEALDQLLERIKSIPDPAERATVMVALFGEEATAMQSAILAVDPSTAAEKMGDFAGATDEAAAKIQATRDPIETAQRSWMDFLQGPLDDLGGVMEENTGWTFQASDALDKFTESTDEGTESADEYVRSLQDIVSASQEVADGVLGLSNAQLGYQAAIDDATQSIVDNGKTLDENTEKGRNNREALNDIASKAWDVVSSMEAQGESIDSVRSYMEGARNEFVQMAINMGMDAAAANALADKLQLIPGNYVANVTLSGYELAAQRVDNIERKIAALPSSKVINLRINTSGSGAGGHFLAGQESGGIVGAGMWGAQTGGVRHSSTVINEAGPEIVELPTGSRVATAGATRALAEMGAFGGGGPVTVVLSLGNTDEIGRAIMRSMRYEIADQYGGSAQAALGQAGAA
jgi:phage-related minor tail protein